MQGVMEMAEEVDETYEPEDQEILEYARYLGMDPDADRELLWIAREGLKAPLPEPWKPYKTDEGEIYYYNWKDQVSVWEHPMDQEFRQLFLKEKAKLTGTTVKEETGGVGLFGESKEDPLLRAEREKRLKERSEALEEQYKAFCAQIDEHYEARKQEIMKQKSEELESQRKNMKRLFQEERLNIRASLEREHDSNLAQLRDSLRRQEEQEKAKLVRASEQKLESLARDVSAKIERERAVMGESYAKIRASVEEAERQKAKMEVERFRSEQSHRLQDKKIDIERLSREQMKIDEEFDAQLQAFRREAEADTQRQKDQLQAQLAQEMADYERQRKEHYELQLERQRRELKQRGPGQGVGDVKRVRDELEREYGKRFEELKVRLKEQGDLQKRRLRELKEEDLKDFENSLKEQLATQLEKRRQNFELRKQNELQELELTKLKLEQQTDELLYRYKKEAERKLDAKKQTLHQDRDRQLQDLEARLGEAEGLGAEKLVQEIRKVQKQHKEAQSALREAKIQLEIEEGRNKELAKNITHTRLELNELERRKPGLEVVGADDSEGVQEMREELKKKTGELRLLEEELQRRGEAGGEDQFSRLLDTGKASLSQKAEFLEKQKGQLATLKRQLKDTQRQLVKDKKKYKSEVEAVESSVGPQRQRGREVLRRVKQALEERFDRYNEKLESMQGFEAQVSALQEEVAAQRRQEDSELELLDLEDEDIEARWSHLLREDFN